MTNFIPHPTNTDGLAKLSGTITKLTVTRAHASFVFTESDQTKMGVVAVAAAVAGLSGQAIAIASSDTEEAADYLEFELNGQPIKGWVWRNPFKEGDVVEVAAEPQGEHWEAFGIARPADKTIALYPHCSRGRITHIKNAIKWWSLGGGGIVFFIGVPLLLISIGIAPLLMKEFQLGFLCWMLFFALVTYSLTRQWLPFVRVAQKVFKALDIPNPSTVDLVKRTKQQKTKQDPVELGVFYFKY